MIHRVSFISPQFVLRGRTSSESSRSARMLVRNRSWLSRRNSIALIRVAVRSGEKWFQESFPSPNAWFSYICLHSPTCCAIARTDRDPAGGIHSHSAAGVSSRVAEKGMPSPSLERLVEEIDVLVERCTRHKPSMLRVESAGDWRTARKYEFGLASSRPQKSASERTRPSERGRPR